MYEKDDTCNSGKKRKGGKKAMEKKNEVAPSWKTLLAAMSAISIGSICALFGAKESSIDVSTM
jgi:hypothetical protein